MILPYAKRERLSKDASLRSVFPVRIRVAQNFTGCRGMHHLVPAETVSQESWYAWRLTQDR